MLPILLLVSSALAGSYTDTFDVDAGAWTAGSVADGVLSVTDTLASYALPADAVAPVTVRAMVRLADGERLRLGPLELDYTDGGGVRLGAAALPFPDGHYAWVPDDEPMLPPGPDFWDGANVVHCEVFYDDDTATWFLYWSGEMAEGYGYRQIGVATSTDGVTWTEYAANPVITIDYDRTTIDGIHVHMPTVVKDTTDTFHMYYACYQNDVGNRLCHATSADGLAWETHGMALDIGAAGEFDSGSLRMPDVLIGDDGTWHMLYNGTDPEQHYGPTGYATSPDGWTWTKHGAITDDESRLQGGGMFAGPYGIEQWWNCNDVFCHSTAEPWALDTWADDEAGVVLAKGWESWTDGYVQAPSPWLVGTTWHMWFNAYSYNDWEGTGVHERLGHAQSVPVPGAWIDVAWTWDGGTVTATVAGAEIVSEQAAVSAIELFASGTVELDEIEVTWGDAPADTGEIDTGGDDTGAADTGAEPINPLPEEEAGCGCGSSLRPPWLALALAGGACAASRRRRTVR